MCVCLCVCVCVLMYVCCDKKREGSAEVGDLNSSFRTMDPCTIENQSHKFLNIHVNFCSLQSLCKRNQLASILSHLNIDIILGCESHIDDSFLSAEILPKIIIRKDRSLGGGVFIGYKSSLQLSEMTTLIPTVSDAEMIWGNSNFITTYISAHFIDPLITPIAYLNVYRTVCHNSSLSIQVTLHVS